jgi:hypothetical protein
MSIERLIKAKRWQTVLSATCPGIMRPDVEAAFMMMRDQNAASCAHIRRVLLNNEERNVESHVAEEARHDPDIELISLKRFQSMAARCFLGIERIRIHTQGTALVTSAISISVRTAHSKPTRGCIL